MPGGILSSMPERLFATLSKMTTFGERLKELRERAGLRPSDLASKVGVTENAIRQMESGYIKSASFGVGVKLADVLGVSARFLALGGTQEIIPPIGESQHETGLRLPEGPIAEAVRLLRAEIAIVKEIAERAEATAKAKAPREADPPGRRPGSKSA